MKLYVKPIAFLIVVFISFSFKGRSQYVVKIRPVAPVVVAVLPNLPGPSHIWLKKLDLA